MKLSHRIFLGYFIVVAIAGFFLIDSVRDELRPAVRQSMEETLVDTANLLAELAATEMIKGTLLSGNFSSSIEHYLSRNMKASIWGLDKAQAAFRIYITDERGVVLYDSQGESVGDDYSQWNDVYLTLKGQYGARSTPLDPNDDATSVMYIAAPILNEDEIIGVLTVAKPNISVLPFIELSQRKIVRAGVLMLVVALGLGLLFSTYLGRSTRRLANYANKVKEGKKVTLPTIAERELSQLGDAIEAMRIALDGKEYVERYVHTLTHEVKSPLTGIMGASELLSDNMSREDRARFIAIIQDETQRIQRIIERLLDLARLEQQQTLTSHDAIALDEIVGEVVNVNRSQYVKQNLRFDIDMTSKGYISGDAFLVFQAIDNVINNAMDFSPVNGVIAIIGVTAGHYMELLIQDEGEGIPDYAHDKVFDRFYSLPRPSTGKKSSGLGLGFVREVMHLHQGEIIINPDSAVVTPSVAQAMKSYLGCRVLLRFPLR